MKNKLSDLNNYLFEQIENLSDEDLKGDKLKQTIAKADKIAQIGQVIIENQKLQLNALKTAFDFGYKLPLKSMNLLLGTKTENGTNNDKEV